MLSPHGCVVLKHTDFKNQETILTSIVRNLCGAGGLAIGILERQWFRQFMNDVEPTLALQLFSTPSNSAPIERLFSKAGFVLNQRRTRLNSLQLEQLLFFQVTVTFIS